MKLFAVDTIILQRRGCTALIAVIAGSNRNSKDTRNSNPEREESNIVGSELARRMPSTAQSISSLCRTPGRVLSRRKLKIETAVEASAELACLTVNRLQ